MEAKTTPVKIRVACIGDSITWGSGMTNRQDECYPCQLQRILGDRYEVRNFGDPGSGVYLDPMMDQYGWRSHPWQKGKSAAAAYKFAPDIVVSNLGINDATTYMYEYEHDARGVAKIESGLFARQYVGLLRAFEKKGRMPRLIIWSKLAPIGKKHRLKGKVDAFVLSRELEVIARTVGAEALDMYTPLIPYAETSDYQKDGVHPEGRAQRAIAEIVARQIRRMSRK